MLDLSKLKAFADDKRNVTEILNFFFFFLERILVESIVGNVLKKLLSQFGIVWGQG